AEQGLIGQQLYPDWFDMPEGQEGAAAFLEKRKPRFWRLRAQAAGLRERLLAGAPKDGGE
ncbi:MAG: hypothetical protein HRU02_19260, partial [Myxococcales bacterium]|nr:hypothetical protein [Myxococcales bacterium]